MQAMDRFFQIKPKELIVNIYSIQMSSGTGLQTVAQKVLNHGLALADKLSISLMRHAAYCTSTFLEICPSLVVRLGLVEVNGFLVLVNLIEEELVRVVLRSQNV